jgi:colicin import membrane protein
MATVKSSDSKRQIAQPTSNKPPQKSTNKGEVKVVKNGIERTFSRSIWDNLPPDKEGYTEVTGPSQAEIDADNKAKADAQAKIAAENQAKADQDAADLKAKEEADAQAKADADADVDVDAKAKADADQKAADDKAAADKLAAENQAKADAQAKTKPAANTQTAQSPTYDEAVKAYTDAYGEAPGQDLTLEEILAKVTAKKQEGK